MTAQVIVERKKFRTNSVEFQMATETELSKYAVLNPLDILCVWG